MGQWFGSSISAQIQKQRRRTAIVVLLVGVASVALGAGVIAKNGYEARAGTVPTGLGGVAVTVVRLETQAVSPFAEFSGRINAVDYAEIRPQVSGRITEIRFHDGEHVNAGDVLLVIDPRPIRPRSIRRRLTCKPQ